MIRAAAIAIALLLLASALPVDTAAVDQYIWNGGDISAAEFGSGENTFEDGGDAAAENGVYAADGFDIMPYLGEWYYSNFVLTIGEDGIASMEPGDEPLPYTVEDGVLTIDGMPCIIDENGCLYVGDENYSLTFSREKPVFDLPENADDYIGRWIYTMSLGDDSISMVLTLNGDNTGSIATGDGEAEPLMWYEDNGTVYVDGTPATLDENGTLTLENEAWPMIFTRTEDKTDAAAEPDRTSGTAAETEPSDDAGFDIAPYIGEWYCDSMTLTISEDGTASITPGGDMIEYTVENGVLMIDGLPCVFDENGDLYVGDESYSLTFTAEKPVFELPENSADYVGEWVYTVTMGEESFSVYLTLNDDGNAVLIYGDDSEAAPCTWYADGGQVYIAGTPAVLGEDGVLTLQDESWPMSFTRNDAVSGTDAADTGSVDIVGRTFAGTRAVSQGIDIDMSLLGRYSVTFYEDGTADMEIGGIMMPVKCTYEIGDGEIVVDYVGVKYIFTVTDTGLTMNYYDTMLIDYEVE